MIYQLYETQRALLEPYAEMPALRPSSIVIHSIP